MINANYARKLIADELKETLFFATGEIVQKQKDSVSLTLIAQNYKVVIHNYKKILVNDDLCTSTPEAKWLIQSLIY